MLHFSRFCAALVAVACVVSGRQLPDDIPTCSRSDPEFDRCARRLVEAVRLYLADGIESVQIPPHDPFRLNRIDVSSGPLAFGTSAVNVTVRGLLIYGFSNFDVDRIEIVSNTPENTTGHIRMSFPSLRLVMKKIEVRGFALNVGLLAKGRSEINITDMKANIMATTRETETDDGLRFEIVSVRSEVRAANLRSSFTSANPVHNYAGAVLSRVFNEHFDEILVALYPAIQHIHENVIKAVIGRVLRNIDAREIIVP